MALLACLIWNSGHGEAIQQRLPSGLVANAEYHAADGKHAVLLVHGFLATHHFPTIQRIAAELRDSGYAVLAPTLTLGINDRTSSLPCDALQLHTMEQTLRELDWWVDWLAAQHYDNIYLIGHSLGSVQVLAYSVNAPHPAVRAQILTSLVAPERLPGKEPSGASAEQAQQWLAAGDHRIAKYDLTFCHGNFTAPPDVYLSYHAWNRERIVDALRRTPVATTVIMGSNDQRFTGTTWMPMLREFAPRLLVLPDANHFFDGMAEFALYDSIVEELDIARSPDAPQGNMPR